MAKFEWGKQKHRGRPSEPAVQKPREKPKGGWSHVPRKPVRHYTESEIAEWEAAHAGRKAP